MISRARGDTQTHEFTLSQTRDMVKTLLDLDLTNKVEFAFNKNGTVIIKLCTKDADPLSGKCYVEFTDDDVDTAGNFPYDIQVTWLNNKKTTFEISLLTLNKDVNET